MFRRLKMMNTAAIAGITALLVATSVSAQQTGFASWQDDLTPISSNDWNYNTAAHLLERAGFGGTPDQIQALAAMSPSAAVRSLVYFNEANNRHLAPFDHSDIHDPGLEPLSSPAGRPRPTWPRKPVKLWVSRSNQRVIAACNRWSTSSSTGSEPACWKPIGWVTGGPIEWLPPTIPFRKKWHCSGTATTR